MKQVKGDLWQHPTDLHVITTNGSVRRDGFAVMGRGVALQACKRYPDLQRELGTLLSNYGNVVHYLPHLRLLTFPVKHHWRDSARIPLIAKSVYDLLQTLKTYNLLSSRISMPRPGCGNGQLSWKVVEPLLIDLPDTITIVNNETDGDHV